MTARWREVVACPKCGMQVSTEPPIKAWIRSHEQLDSRHACLCIGDSDLWILRYGSRRRHIVERAVQYLMLVEVKTHGRDIDDPQRDLLHIINQLLRTVPWKEQRDNGRFLDGHLQNVRHVYSRMAGNRVQVHCYGVHKLRLNGSTPNDSVKMTWDDKPITSTQFNQLLRFDLSPDSLNPMDHRSHKRANGQQMTLLDPALYVIRRQGTR